MKTLILHIGQHKTGTTAIQRTLHQNQTALTNCGLEFPKAGYFQFAQHFFMPVDFPNMSEAEKSYAWSSFADRIDHVNRIESDVILSSENFSLITPAIAQQLKDTLACDNIRVIFYLRNFLGLIYSHWNVLIRTYKSGESLGSFVDDYLDGEYLFGLAHLENCLHVCAEYFGRNSIEIYLFDEILRDVEDITLHFVQHVLSVDPQRFEFPAKPINRSFGRFLAEVIRYGNTVFHHDNEVNGRFEKKHRDVFNAIKDSMKTVSAPYERTLDLAYDEPESKRAGIMRSAEMQFLNNWSDRIKTPLPADNQLFRKRQQRLGYIDPGIWDAEDILKEQMQRLVDELSCDKI